MFVPPCLIIVDSLPEIVFNSQLSIVMFKKSLGRSFMLEEGCQALTLLAFIDHVKNIGFIGTTK